MVAINFAFIQKRRLAKGAVPVAQHDGCFVSSNNIVALPVEVQSNNKIKGTVSVKVALVVGRNVIGVCADFVFRKANIDERARIDPLTIAYWMPGRIARRVVKAIVVFACVDTNRLIGRIGGDDPGALEAADDGRTSRACSDTNRCYFKSAGRNGFSDGIGCKNRRTVLLNFFHFDRESLFDV